MARPPRFCAIAQPAEMALVEIDRALCQPDLALVIWLVVATGRVPCHHVLATAEAMVLAIDLVMESIDPEMALIGPGMESIDPGMASTAPVTLAIGQIVLIRVLETIARAASTTGTNGTIFDRTIGHRSTTIGEIVGKTIGMIATTGSTATGGTIILATIGIGLVTAIGGVGPLGER